jgi:hypothetical protein
VSSANKLSKESADGTVWDQYDYLLFHEDETDEVFGFVSRREQKFQPQAVEKRTGRPLLEEFRALLGNENLMFAVDARHYYMP